MSHSNFRRSKVAANPGDARLKDGGGNQEADPLFSAPAVLDFHELAGSPTIDAGGATAALGTTDLDGRPRIQGAAPDIGAYETATPPPVDMTRPVASLLSDYPGTLPTGRGARGRPTARRHAHLLRARRGGDREFTVKRIVRRIVRHRRRTSYVPVRGSLTDAGKVGGNSLRFSGRLRGKRLKPGRYRLVALPVDAAGNTGNAVLTQFRVVR